jgi:uncharacterized membrane-anchored protein
MLAIAGGILLALLILFAIATLFDRDARGFGVTVLVIIAAVAFFH